MLECTSKHDTHSTYDTINIYHIRGAVGNRSAYPNGVHKMNMAICRLLSERRSGNMLELNYRDARPIYEQIKDGLRRLILSDVIRQDEKLPSVRELASQLAINPNTIQKAYRELEQEGYVYTVSGRGSFAAPLSDVRSGRQEILLEQFDETVTELLYLKKDPDELKKRIDELQQGGAKA